MGAAERVLHELGFRQCRVRHHGSVARVEVESDDLGRALEVAKSSRRRVRLAATSPDLEGFRSGT